MNRKWMQASLVCSVVALAGVTSADTSMSPDEYVKREKDAVATYSEANQVSQRYGRYERTRSDLLSPSGLSLRVENWEKASQDWIASWTKVLALADVGQDFSYQEFERVLGQTLSELQGRLAVLEKDGRSIKAEGERLLARIPPNADTYTKLGAYRTVLDLLKQREKELFDSVQTISGIPQAKITKLREIDTVSRQAVLGRLRASLLRVAGHPVEQTVSSLRTFLAAEQIAEPVLIQVTNAEQEMSRYVLNLQVYHAEEASQKSKALCEDGLKTLGQISAPAQYVAGAKTRAKTLCAAIAKQYSELVSYGVPKNDLVREYIEVERAALPTLCKGANAPVQCEKLAVIAALQTQDYAKMNDDKLKFVEYGWAELMGQAKR